MKRIFKYIGLFVLIMAMTTCVYYGYCLHAARKYTREIILPNLARSQWRHPGGEVHKFEVWAADLSTRQTRILVKVQDPGFYHHNGIDLSTPGAGLTTITQAIVKKLYFNDFRPGLAKIKQTLIARFVVNDMVSKDEQLTLFLNTMNFGDVGGQTVVGLASAANAYYGQSLKSLNEDQYISLIATLVMPGTFHIIDHPEWNKDRSNRIKALMAGRYKPKGLMDQFYGPLPQAVIDAGLPPASYFENTQETGR